MMEDEEDNELDLNIPVKPLLEDISCPICLNFIEECSTLSCGHNFCHKCVSECINRNHKCPLCNKPTVKENIYRNHQFEKVIKIIRTEKEKSKTIYYDNLISSSSSSSSSISTTTTTDARQPMIVDDSTGTTISTTSPIENLFKKYLKSSLISFESYYQDLSKPFNENIKKLNKTMEQQIQGIPENASLNEILIDQIKKEYKIKEDKLNQDFKVSTDYLLSSLEEYLKKTAIPPSFLNIYTSIMIPEREIIFDHCSFKPTSNLSDIRSTLVEKLNNRGDKFQFISFTDDSHFVVLKPTSMLSNDISDIDSNEIRLVDELKPLYLYKIPPGSKIQLRGGIQLKGDIPKDCFKKVFQGGTNQIMDYYRCEDCKQNWLCKNCSEFCHRSHKVVSFILNHKPTHGCCYCEKSKCCKLLNRS